MKKFSIILTIYFMCFFVFLFSCSDNCKLSDEIKQKYDFQGMTYGIFLTTKDHSLISPSIDLRKELDPFYNDYEYSDKSQRQAYIKEVEKMYNIKIDFTVNPSDKDCYVNAWNTYPILNESLTDKETFNYAYSLFNFETDSGVLKDSRYLNDSLKVEMSSVKNNIYIYYPGKVYSYNFLYYNSQKDFGEHNPLELYKDNNWDLESYKYVLENYCDESINSSDNIKNDNYIATMPSKLAKGLTYANGYYIINKNGFNGNTLELNQIFNESIDLFYNYYKYDNNNLIDIFYPIYTQIIDHHFMSSFNLNNTIVSASLTDFYKKETDSYANLSNEIKWQLIPYPSSNYENYYTYVDGYNQLGFTVVGDYNFSGEKVTSFTDDFTREIAFEILYDLFDGYFNKYSDIQLNNIKEFLGRHLTKESIDLFFKFNENINFDASNVLYELYEKSSYGLEHYNSNLVEKRVSLAGISLDSFLLMDESFIETYFSNYSGYDNHIIFNDKFDYKLKLKYQNNYLEMSIDELYRQLYDSLLKIED